MNKTCTFVCKQAIMQKQNESQNQSKDAKPRGPKSRGSDSGKSMQWGPEPRKRVGLQATSQHSSKEEKAQQHAQTACTTECTTACTKTCTTGCKTACTTNIHDSIHTNTKNITLEAAKDHSGRNQNWKK